MMQILRPFPSGTAVLDFLPSGRSEPSGPAVFSFVG